MASEDLVAVVRSSRLAENYSDLARATNTVAEPSYLQENVLLKPPLSEEINLKPQ